MNDLNRILLTGRLTRDPELRSTTSGTFLCKISIACNESRKVGDKYEDFPHFFNVTFWGKRAEVVSKHFTKGQQILIEGKLNLNKWDDKEGKTHYDVSIRGENFFFMGKKSDGSFGTPSSAEEAGVSAGLDGFSEPFNDDLPF